MKFMRLFSALDTSVADAAIDRAEQSQRDLSVRNRAIRMDVACVGAAARITQLLEQMHHPLTAVPQGIPPDMQALLDKLT